MYKYIFFVVLGILIYLLLNRKDNFSVGVPDQSIIDGLFANINTLLDEKEIDIDDDDETFDSIRVYLSELSDEDFDRLISSLNTDDKKLQYFLDCRRYININYRLNKLYAYYTDTGITIEELLEDEYITLNTKDDGTILEPLTLDNKYYLYEVINININSGDFLEDKFRMSGDIKPSYGIISNKLVYYFIERKNDKNYIRGRVVISHILDLDSDKLWQLTIFPVGHNLGNILFRLLIERGESINDQDFRELGAKRSYRRLYHLSVTLKTEDGFSDDGNFTIFRPDVPTARRLYGDLYDQLDSIPLTEWDHNKKALFLMSIDLDDMEDIIRIMEEDDENILEEYIDADTEQIEKIMKKINTLYPPSECAADTD